MKNFEILMGTKENIESGIVWRKTQGWNVSFFGVLPFPDLISTETGEEYRGKIFFYAVVEKVDSIKKKKTFYQIDANDLEGIDCAVQDIHRRMEEGRTDIPIEAIAHTANFLSRKAKGKKTK